MNVLAFLPLAAIPVLLIAAQIRADRLRRTRPNTTENLALLLMTLGGTGVGAAQLAGAA
jgi:hypothetical protein